MKLRTVKRATKKRPAVRELESLRVQLYGQSKPPFYDVGEGPIDRRYRGELRTVEPDELRMVAPFNRKGRVTLDEFLDMPKRRTT